MNTTYKILYFGGNDSVKSIIGLNELLKRFDKEQLYVVFNTSKKTTNKPSFKAKLYNALFDNFKVKLPYTNLSALCKAENLNFLETDAPRNIELSSAIKDFAPDFLISNGWGWIINDQWIKLPKLKALNCHSSLLPEYKGPSVYKHVLMNFESKTGLTVHELTSKIDEGVVYAQKEIKINKKEVPSSLLYRLAKASAPVIIDAIENVIADKPIKNENNKGFYVSKVSPLVYAKNRLKNRIKMLVGRDPTKYCVK